MHPEIARPLIEQHYRDLLAQAQGRIPRTARRRLTIPGIPRWRITWSQVAAPAAGTGGQAWLIIITTRSARSAHRIA